MILLGAAQPPVTADPARNLETLQQYAKEAAAAGCRALCFPEAFLTGYCPEEASLRALSAQSQEIGSVSRLARELQMDLLVGFMEADGPRLHLTQGIFRPDGTRALYRKTHLGEKELQVFTPGDALEVFPLSCGLRVGFQICVETHFPEITQTLALAGAQVVFAPHAVPGTAEKRSRIWSRFIPARSYDNRVYLACCNLWDGRRFGGGCLVTDPRGDRVAERFEDSPGLLLFPVDPALPESFRREPSTVHTRFYPARRRPHLYR